jgi:hypothetical protein
MPRVSSNEKAGRPPRKDGIPGAQSPREPKVSRALEKQSRATAEAQDRKKRDFESGAKRYTDGK